METKEVAVKMRVKLSRMFTRVAVTSLILCFSIEGAFASTDPKLDLAPINPAFLRWMERKSNNVDTKKAVRTLLRDGAAESKNSGDGKEYGLIPEPFDTSYLKALRKNVKARSVIPARYDLREKGLLTSIKNQGTNGTCWAHAVCGVLESSLLKAGEGIYDFSENNMANLHGFDWDFNKGGNATLASAYLLRWSGPVLESQDPYPNVGGSTEVAPARHVQNIRWIPGRLDYTDNDHIKQAVINYGAIYVNYHHDGSYLASDGKSYCFDFSGTNDTNHAVVIVGWDDNYPASKFKNVPVGNGAFIMRNSWGTGHGENGYFYVSYYDKIFGWHTMHAFLPPEEVDNYDSIYQYDPLGNTLAWGWGGETSWGANIFHAKSLERIQAVGFYALTPNTSYEIYVYRGCQSDNPRSGTLDATLNGVTDSAGYFTMPLSSNAVLQKGDRFSVVIKLTTPGYDNPLAIEHSITFTKENGEEDPYSTKAESAPGQSFMSPDGNYWRDITDFYETMNFCCKVYTTSVSSSEGINNDNFENAALLSGESGELSASNAGATFESGEPEHNYSSATTSVWWKWTPTKSGSVTFSTEGSSFDTILAVYTGSTLLSLEQYALDDDGGTDNTSICTFEAVAGTTYYIAVAGYNAKTGTINLSWEQTIELLPNLMFPIREKWPQPVFLSNVTGGVVSVNSFDCGETVYLNVAFGNDGDISTTNEFTIIMEVMNENGELIGSKLEYANKGLLETSTSVNPPYWGNFQWGSLNNLAPGSYTYRCTLDVYDEIKEIDESDNVWEYEFTVLPPPDVISVVPVSISCNGNGIGINDDYHINVSANCSWKAEVSDEWIKIYGHDYGNGDGRIWIGVESNLTKDSRFGTITFLNEGGSVKCSVSIAQDGASVQFVIEDGVLIDCIAEGGTEAIIPNTVVSIGNSAFFGCKTLTTVVLPGCVTNIGSYAFSGCSGLINFIIPEGVITIGEGAFYGCSSLEEVVIPDGVKEIRYRTFDGCLKLKSVKIPNSVKSIGSDVFDEWCWNLFDESTIKGVRLVDGWCVGYNDELSGALDLTMTRGVSAGAFQDCINLEEVKLPVMKSVENYMFDGCTSLRKVQIPDGVRRLGACSFGDCSSLSSISIPSTVKLLDPNVFTGCSDLLFDRTTIPGIEMVDGWVIKGEKSLSGVLDISDVRGIAGGAFDGCTKLTDVVFPNNIESIGNATFKNCTGLTEIVIPSKVVDIGVNVFYGCENLKKVFLPLACKDYINENDVFRGTSGNLQIIYYCNATIILNANGGELPGELSISTITGVAIGTLPTPTRDGYTFLGWFTAADGGEQVTADTVVTGDMTLYAQWEEELKEPSFEIDENGVLSSVELNGATEIIIPSNVKVIAEEALSGCCDLTSVTIPEGVVSIGYDAFNCCCALTSINIPSTVTNIGDNAFGNCTNLRIVTGGEGLKRVGYDAFYNTLFLYKADSWEDVEDYANGYGLDLVRLGNFIVGRRGSLEEARNDEYFDENENWTWEYNLVIPEGITGMADGLFDSLPITSVTIPNSVDSIPDAAFASTMLESIVIPENVISIGEWAFRWCENLTYAKVPIALKEQVEEGGVFTDCSPDLQIEYYEVQPLALPVITPADGSEFYEDSCTVTISCATEGASIYYVVCDTNNVTNPRPSDRNLYTGPFTVSATKMVRAFSMFGSKTSDIVSSTLIKRELTLPVAVDAPALTFTTGGDAQWTPVFDGSAKVGGSFAQSGALSWSMEDDDPSETWMETTVAGSGTFSFWWKVECEDDPFGCTWDRFEVYTNDVEAARIDGKTEWAKMEFTFTDSGTHTVRWRFCKDDWDDEKLTDLAWVDGVIWTSASIDVTVDVGNGKNVVVPVSWIDKYGDILAAAGGDKSAALLLTAANGRKVWECFMLGVDPTKADDDFRITRFWMEGGKPMFEFSHSTDGAGNSFTPRIKTKGKVKLSDSWSYVPDGGNPSFRFFTVEIELP